MIYGKNNLQNLTSFELLAIGGHIEALKWVIQKWWKEVKIPTEQGHMLAIHLAAYHRRLDVVKLFMDNRVPPNVHWNTIDKATPLHFAVSK